MHMLGIDQHRRHLTINLRDEQAKILAGRQVKTEWDKVDAFLQKLQDQAAPHGGYVAIVEVCGFNDWLIKRLEKYGCKRVCVVKAPERVRQKTDRRDAAKLSELLWLNRDRIAAGEPLIHVHEVYQATEDEEYDRQLTHIRERLGKSLSKIKNRIKGILRKHNLQQHCPTKDVFCKTGLRWLRDKLELPELDRVAMNIWLDQFGLHELQIDEVNARIKKRAEKSESVRLLRTAAKMGHYTALAIAAHVGPIERFPNAKSLSNYFGVVPGCRNSGDSDRPGSITKAGHPFIRFLLGQMVLHALKSDPGLRVWYHRTKRRRGCKIARVAIMRRMCEAIWHILTYKEPYRPVGSASRTSVRRRREECVV